MPFDLILRLAATNDTEKQSERNIKLKLMQISGHIVAWGVCVIASKVESGKWQTEAQSHIFIGKWSRTLIVTEI